MNTETEYMNTMNTKLVIVIFLLTFFFTLKKQAYPNQEKNWLYTGVFRTPLNI